MKSFKVEIKSGFKEWDRYNVFMAAVCYDVAGAAKDYVCLNDKHDALQIPSCERADLYIWVVANTFPASDVIAASPPFEVEILVSTDKKTDPTSTRFEVNQWGGLSVKMSLD